MNTLTADYYFALNTRRPPFNNLQARQAINYAANRSAYVKIEGGPSLAVPTCQILPPNFPSYTPYCPYTAGTNHTKWTAPDMAKAKQLVQQSHTAGMKVVVDGTNDQVGKALVEQMVSDLNAIGYKASTQLLAASIQYPFVQNSSNSGKWNVGYSAWYQDYPARVGLPERAARLRDHPSRTATPARTSPRSAIRPSSRRSTRPRRWERPTRAAPRRCGRRSTTPTPTRRPWVDMFNPKQIDVLSHNVHGYSWSPQWYILIDRLWLSS